MTNKNFKDECNKYGIDTKGADFGKVQLALPKKLRDRFCHDADDMATRACRCFVQAVFDTYNQMRTVGSDQELDESTIIAETRALLDK